MKSVWKEVNGPVTVKTAREVEYGPWGARQSSRFFKFNSFVEAIEWADRYFYLSDLKYGHLKKYWWPPLLKGKWEFNAYNVVNRPLEVTHGDEIIFLDECGLVIPVWRVLQEYHSLPRPKPYRRRWSTGAKRKWRKSYGRSGFNAHRKEYHFSLDAKEYSVKQRTKADDYNMDRW